YYARRNAEAVAQLEKVLKTDPEFIPAKPILGMAYIQAGRSRDAVALLENVDPKQSLWALDIRGYALARSGRIIEARRIATNVPWPLWTCLPLWTYLGLGDADQAVRSLESLAEYRSPSLTALKVAPEYDSLRNDPRFQRLLKTVGLAP